MTDENITQSVRARYARAAALGEQMCCPTGYDLEQLSEFIPQEVLNISYGCGTPAGLDTLRDEETVLDIGSGGGIDCFEALRRVGPRGHVIGIDMTDEMLAVARRNAPIVLANLRHPTLNVEFRKGTAEALPVDDGSVDVILSNCVINLTPDKSKVFREMYRVLRSGGRFTISDIVSDQSVPNYLVYDTEKWGNCLSGALQIGEYITGLVEAGFRGLHQLGYRPWKIIDGIHFFSITLTGRRLPETADQDSMRFATLRGPFSTVTDEFGQTYHRGKSKAIDGRTVQLLRRPPFEQLFLLTACPLALENSDPRLSAILPQQSPCVWKGDYAILAGPFTEAWDDDGHRFRRGQPLEVCSKTLTVLSSEEYSPHFAVINRATGDVAGTQVSCDSAGGCC